jgi:hypothetical protein
MAAALADVVHDRQGAASDKYEGGHNDEQGGPHGKLPTMRLPEAHQPSVIAGQTNAPRAVRVKLNPGPSPSDLAAALTVSVATLDFCCWRSSGRTG